MSTCRGCGATIEWVRMKSGKAMPVDPEPVFVEEEGSQVFVTDEGDTITGWRAWPQTPEEKARMTVAYIPHWSTCPEARQFRRRP